jgi:hypothetical protein
MRGIARVGAMKKTCRWGRGQRPVVYVCLEAAVEKEGKGEGHDEQDQGERLRNSYAAAARRHKTTATRTEVYHLANCNTLVPARFILKRLLGAAVPARRVSGSVCSSGRAAVTALTVCTGTHLPASVWR